MKISVLRSWVLCFAALLISFTVFAKGANSLAIVALADLPVEARMTILRIKQGGPFPFSKDGVIFGNHEGVLPKQKRGYYHEFTVSTPKERSRGARRIIVGGIPMALKELYYTDDHYATFKRIKE